MQRLRRAEVVPWTQRVGSTGSMHRKRSKRMRDRDNARSAQVFKYLSTVRCGTARICWSAYARLHNRSRVRRVPSEKVICTILWLVFACECYRCRTCPEVASA
jgi:hypothetical protein